MSSKNRKIMGPILIIIGLVLIGRTFDLFHFDFGDLFRALIPLGVIFLGVWMIMRRKRIEDKMKVEVHFDGQSTYSGQQSSAQASHFSSTTPEPEPLADTPKMNREKDTQSPKVDPSGRAKYEKLFGDIFIDLNNVKTHNVEVSMFIGDIEINLNGADLQMGLNRIIISSFIGDIRIFAPKDMAVFTCASNFIGDIEAIGKRSSGFGNSLEAQTANYDTAEKKMYIAANNFIGDIKIFQI